MHPLQQLFENNRAWSERIRRSDPDFFQKLSRQQRPRYLWIGCADSRVPANEIVGLQPARAEVILAGACVVRTVLVMLDAEQLTVSDRGLRHGVIAERFGRTHARA